jgi:hypothetical protein
VKVGSKQNNRLVDISDYIENRREMQDSKLVLAGSPVGQSEPPVLIGSQTQLSEPVEDKNRLTNMALKRADFSGIGKERRDVILHRMPRTQGHNFTPILLGYLSTVALPLLPCLVSVLDGLTSSLRVHKFGISPLNLAVTVTVLVSVSQPLKRVLCRLNRRNLLQHFNVLNSDATTASGFVTAETPLLGLSFPW